MHLGFGRHRRAAARDVEVARVNKDAGGAQVRKQGQRLVQRIGDVQAHVLGQAAVVGIEVAIGPLIALAGGLFTVVPAVFGTHRHHVLARDQRGADVEAEGRHPVLV